MRPRWLLGLVFVVVTLALAASTGEAGTAATVRVEVVPRSPAANSDFVLLIRGTAPAGSMIVLYKAPAGCLSGRAPLERQLFLDNPEVHGSFSRRVSLQLVGAGPVHYCIYLSATSYTGDDPPLARADVVVTGGLRLGDRQLVPAHDHAGHYDVTYAAFALFADRTGTRFRRVSIECGGPGRANGWFTKRFTARINLPLAPKLHWSGAVRPDNGGYEPPVPPKWYRPVHLTFDLRLGIDEQGGLLRGTARLTGPGLPCPVVHRITPAR